MPSSIENASQRKGELFAVTLTLIEAWFPIFAFFTVTALGGLHAYFYSLSVAAMFLGGWWVLRRKVHEVRDRQAYFPLAMTGLLITSVFALVFTALQYTSPNNVALILFLQVLFSYLFLGRKQGERLSVLHTLGVILMTLGAVLVLFPEHFVLRLGDLLVLLAAMLAPIGNLYQKQARQSVSSETILLVRTLLALPFLYALARLFEPSPSWGQIEQQAIWLLLTGLLVFTVSKIFWVEALHRLPITKVNALYAISPLLTIALSYWLLDDLPTPSQMAGVIPILLGGILLTRRAKA
ncbi:MAG: DMT family transporter [Hydrogenovibrio sp.]|nr:DMT family transporter [Hydrogenovibrio sp.]